MNFQICYQNAKILFFTFPFLLAYKYELDNNVSLFKKKVCDDRLQWTHKKTTCIVQVLSVVCPDGVFPSIFSFALFK